LDTAAGMQIKLVCHVLQDFKYLHLFFHKFTTTLYTFSPQLNQSLHPPLLKVSVSLQEPLPNSHNDSIIIGEVFPTKAILHRAKQVKV
jgi:hypothetical protein